MNQIVPNLITQEIIKRLNAKIFTTKKTKE